MPMKIGVVIFENAREGHPAAYTGPSRPGMTAPANEEHASQGTKHFHDRVWPRHQEIAASTRNAAADEEAEPAALAAVSRAGIPCCQSLVLLPVRLLRLVQQERPEDQVVDDACA